MLVKAVLTGKPAFDLVNDARNLVFQPSDGIANAVPDAFQQVCANINDLAH